MQVKAPAKLNLNLHVLPQLNKNGLYPIRFVNCQLDLSDEINLILQSKKIEVSCQYDDICHCNKKNLCRGKKNLVIKAAEILRKRFGTPELGVEIFINKRIPPKVGLAGGSADAAAVLNGLNNLWQLRLSQRQLLKIAQQLGMDVQYCLVGGLCTVEGRKGEKIKKLRYSLPKYWLVIVVPSQEKPSTAWAYKNLDRSKIGRNTHKIEKLIKAIAKKDLVGITKNLHNDFETVIFKKYPQIENIKKKLEEYGALKTILAGSGLALVAFFKDRNQARKCYNNLCLGTEKVFLTSLLT